jgi:hypothetical protein
MKHAFLPVLLFFLAQNLLAQPRQPIIRASSANVAIKDGDHVEKDAWYLTPEARPDVYVADRTRKTKWVTFYTDLDSIRIKVKPGTKFDFIILLNGKDSCFTRVVSAIQPHQPAKVNFSPNAPDTIPFTLTARHAMHVKAIVNDQDTLNLHFDTGSSHFRFTRDAILAKTHLLADQPDALAGKTQPNFNKMRPVSTLRMGKLVWKNPTVLSTGLTSTGMDGRFGLNLFEDKIVEIDYDKGYIIIHSKLPKTAKAYTKADLVFLRSFACIKGRLQVNDKTFFGYFLLDSGSDKAMILDSMWRVHNNFPKDLKVLKTSKFRNPRGEVFESKSVVCPALFLHNLPVSNVPTTLLGSKNPVDFELNFLGNDVLRRFNTILDFQKDRVYLKPNHLINEPFSENS